MKTGRISLNGLASGMDTDAMIKELMGVQNFKKTRLMKKKMSVEYKQEEWKKLNTKINNFYKKELSDFRLKSSFISNKLVSSNDKVASPIDSANAPEGVHKLEVLKLATNAATVSGKLEVGGEAATALTTMAEMGLTGEKFEISYKNEQGELQKISIEAEAEDTLIGFTEKIKKATQGKLDMNVNLDTTNHRLFLSTKETGENQSFTLSGQVAQAFGFSGEEVKGQDAEYRYNDMADTFKSAKNEIEVNNLTANLRSVGETTISVRRDTESTYKKVTSFIKAYNTLLEDLQNKYNVAVPRGQRDMQPLTAEEKKAMSEDDAKKWEENLRGRVFKRDAAIGKLVQDMRSKFNNFKAEDNPVGFQYLSDLGIATGRYDFGTGGMLFIQGDEELGGVDSGKENKLKAALEKDPEAVAELLSKAGKALYDDLSEKMKADEGRIMKSHGSFYNDKLVDKEYKSFDRRIEDMEDKLNAMEERYRRQFAAMEAALQKSNNASGWLTQQFAKM